jgi:hypothetical protein
MARSVEILRTGEESVIGTALLDQIAAAAQSLDMATTISQTFRGGSDWLALFGPGAVVRDAARHRQIANGGKAACWDLGYLGAGKLPGVSYLRVSVDHNHPWRDFDATPSDGSRLDAFGPPHLRTDAAPGGPVIVIGMGPKSRTHLGLTDWEMTKLRELKQRFPKHSVLYRPKPVSYGGKVINRDKHIDWPLSELGPIADTLRGASLVVCRHSNVAVDACIAGIPVECEDGAAYWLYRNRCDPSLEERIDFLRRLTWWQWRTDEQKEAWQFLNTICA